jgi:hypothetical protein
VFFPSSSSPNFCDSEGKFSVSPSHLRGSRDVQVRREPCNRQAVLVSANNSCRNLTYLSLCSEMDDIIGSQLQGCSFWVQRTPGGQTPSAWISFAYPLFLCPTLGLHSLRLSALKSHKFTSKQQFEVLAQSDLTEYNTTIHFRSVPGRHWASVGMLKELDVAALPHLALDHGCHTRLLISRSCALPQSCILCV